MKTILIFVLSFLFITNTSKLYSQYTDIEKTGLLLILQEEKVAYDFYSAMFEKYNHVVFQNVMSAEKTHQEHVMSLIKELNIDATGVSQNAGEFSDKDIIYMFDLLMRTGNSSFTDALLASARYEEKDISDLRKNYSNAENETIKALYNCLDKASQNHLKAFVKNLKKEGISYKPTELSQEAFNLIIENKNQESDCFKTN